MLDFNLMHHLIQIRQLQLQVMNQIWLKEGFALFKFRKIFMIQFLNLGASVVKFNLKSYSFNCWLHF